MVYNIKNNKGITITALLVTVIILLILAGATINYAMGSDGIITKAKSATSAYKKEAIREKLELKLSELNIKKITTDGGNLTIDDLYEIEDDEISVAEASEDTVFVYIDDYQCEIGKDLSIISINPKQQSINQVKKVNAKVTSCTIER